ncbi:MAG: hypothetical protein ACFFDI_18895 [Promethearchaeota archaeon]
MKPISNIKYGLREDLYATSLTFLKLNHKEIHEIHKIISFSYDGYSELPDAKAIRLPRSTTALAEARLIRMEIQFVILTSVAALISRGVTFMRSACS